MTPAQIGTLKDKPHDQVHLEAACDNEEANQNA